MAWIKQLSHPGKNLLSFFKWVFFGCLVGAIGGLLGTGFHYSLSFVTGLREHNTWLIFLLPIGGLLSVGIYKLCKMQTNRGTNEVVDAVLDGKSVNPLIAPVMFVASGITHLFGGSAGREGAALQIGGSSASLLGRLFGLKDGNRRILTMCGMSAVFAGLFGTPLTACLFTMEFVSVGTIFTPALLPCLLSAYVASRVSLRLEVHPEGMELTQWMDISWDTAWRYATLAVLLAVLGVAMCWIFHKLEHLASKKLKNPFVRIAVGGALIVGLTLLAGNQRFNGAGMEMALEAVRGHADWYSFAVKLLFTAITLAAGFKGGEIVPTFCIGATFGCVMGGVLGLDPGFCAALGLVPLFCCATNSPITSIILSIEMFGATNVYLFAIICVVCFVLSGHTGLYASQIHRFNGGENSLRNQS